MSVELSGAIGDSERYTSWNSYAHGNSGYWDSVDTNPLVNVLGVFIGVMVTNKAIRMLVALRSVIALTMARVRTYRQMFSLLDKTSDNGRTVRTQVVELKRPQRYCDVQYCTCFQNGKKRNTWLTNWKLSWKPVNWRRSVLYNDLYKNIKR